MPQGNTGKVIESIDFKKKKIHIHFLSGESLTLTPDQYTQDYFYTGKVIDSKSYDQMVVANQNQPFIDYGFRLLSKGRYTEYQVREKLYHRKAIKPQVDLVIERLKQAHLIDDQTLMVDWVNHYQKKGYGYRLIKQKLIEKGVASAKIETITLDSQIQKDAIQFLLKQWSKKYARISERQKKEKIKQNFMVRGFDIKDFSSYLEALPSHTEAEEGVNLDLAYQKAVRTFSRRFEGEVFQEKVINFLIRKGYTYPNIRRKLKESSHVD